MFDLSRSRKAPRSKREEIVPGMTDAGLGVTMAMSARAPETPPELKALHAGWAKHLDGDRILDAINGDLEKLKSPEDAQKAVDEWKNSCLGVVCDNFKIRDLENRLVAPSLSIDRYQIPVINGGAKFTIVNKCRRSGGSFAAELRACGGVFLPQAPFNSYFYNMSHPLAKQRIEHCYSIIRTAPRDFLRQRDFLSKGIKAQLQFMDKDTGMIFTISARAQVEPRDIEGFITLDEFCKYIDQQGMYNAAQNSTAIRGDVLIVSTPGAKDDLFADIFEGRGKGYHNFDGRRYKIQWWKCPRLVKLGIDPQTGRPWFELAQNNARHMATQQRVELYASPFLMTIWDGRISDEHFQVEQECSYVDDSTSYYPWKIMAPCITQMPVEGFSETIELQAGESAKLSAVEQKIVAWDINPAIYDTPESLALAIQRGKVGRQLALGIDTGYVDGTQLTITELCKHDMAVVRYREKFKQTEPVAVLARIQHIVHLIPFFKVAIDTKDREGAAIASHLRHDPAVGSGRLVEIEGSAKLNEEMAVDLRFRMELVLIVIPAIDDLINDIRKIKPALTANGSRTIEAKRDKDGHAEEFFSLIYSLSCWPRVSGRRAASPIEIGEKSGISKRIVPPRIGVTSGSQIDTRGIITLGSLSRGNNNGLVVPRGGMPGLIDPGSLIGFGGASLPVPRMPGVSPLGSGRRKMH